MLPVASLACVRGNQKVIVTSSLFDPLDCPRAVGITMAHSKVCVRADVHASRLIVPMDLGMLRYFKIFLFFEIVLVR